MALHCPYCVDEESFESGGRNVVRVGHFYRTSDSKRVRRFRCLSCKKGFSTATFHPCFKQKKRQLNEFVRRNLCSGMSERRCARDLNLNRKTVARKLVFLGKIARVNLEAFNRQFKRATVVEFDDLETFEHSKCKPVAVTLAVESKTRRILGLEVSQMSYKGRLAKKGLENYGLRKDHRYLGRYNLFKKLEPLVEPNSVFRSDQNPYYERDLKRRFPESTHQTVKGQRGANTGQGELKKIGFDPLFSLNHTCAKFRDDVKCLARKTWCTTKSLARLSDRLALYAEYHNQHLKLA